MPTAAWRLTAADVPALARGARLLGAGGGGDTALCALLAQRELADGDVEVVDPAALAPDGLVVAVAMLGSPAIMAELVPAGGEFVRALQGLERHLEARAVAVMGLETAGVNAFPPLLVARALGLPLLDLDGMGRAFPRLDHTVLHARGAPAGPLALTGSRGEFLVVDVPEAPRGEALARASLAALGGWAGVACFPQRAAAAASSALHGTLRRALRLGGCAADATSPADLAERAGGRLLAEGRVFAVERPAPWDAPRGTVLVEPADAPGATLRVEFQSEYLVVVRDGTVVAATPELVVLVDGHTLGPIACERVRRGDDLAVLALAADAAWHEPAALALAGPAAFGYPGAA